MLKLIDVESNLGNRAYTRLDGVRPASSWPVTAAIAATLAIAALVASSAVFAADPPRDDALFAYGYHDEPYRLDSGPHLFLDWRYVYPGRVGYALPDGREVGKEGEGLTPADIGRILSRPSEIPYGIRLEAQAAEKIGPVLEIDKPWEYLTAYVSVIRVDDEYRMYYEAIPSKDSTVPGYLCLATSRDGLEWQKNELGIVDYAGNKKNNIVFGGPLCRYGLHGHQVFIDPRAPREERFKLVYMANHVKERDPELVARMKRERPEGVNPWAESKHLVIMSAVSADGLHWTERPEPLMGHMNDSGPAVYYDERLERYVGYFRMFIMNRRAIGRSETTDFRRWPAPSLVLWPHALDDPTDDYYTNSHTLYPGTKTMHLMFPVCYKRSIDGARMRMASSVDGVNWQWLPGGDILANGAIGSWDAGWFVGGVGMLEIPGDRVALPYQASPLPHKFPRVMPLGQVGLACWPKERLCALVADQDGEFTTVGLSAEGDELYLNFHTPRTGAIQVQVDGVPGRSFADCDPLFGNELKRLVTWKGQTTLGVAPGESFRLRFRMHHARLYSFELRGSIAASQAAE